MPSALAPMIEEVTSLSEGLFVRADIDAYVADVCDALEDEGYEIPDSFRLESLLGTLSLLDGPSARLTEEKRGLFHRALMALRGAVLREVVGPADSFHKDQFDRYRRNASSAFDKATSKHPDPEASADYVRNYRLAAYHQSRADPLAHKQQAATHAQYHSSEHGSKQAALDILHHGRVVRGTDNSPSKKLATPRPTRTPTPSSEGPTVTGRLPKAN